MRRYKSEDRSLVCRDRSYLYFLFEILFYLVFCERSPGSLASLGRGFVAAEL